MILKHDLIVSSWKMADIEYIRIEKAYKKYGLISVAIFSINVWYFKLN